MEGKIIVLQTADLVQTRKMIPDYVTWSHVAVLAAHQPERLADLMGYQSLIARVSKKYKWPSWVIYDQNFRQEAIGNPDQPWATSLYMQCFTGQELSWCTKCQGLDHSSADCPYQTRKCPWSTVAGSTGGTPRNSRNEQQPCLNYNRYQENCRFGRECHFQHVCSNCRGPYPVSRCKAGATQQKD